MYLFINIGTSAGSGGSSNVSTQTPMPTSTSPGLHTVIATRAYIAISM